MRKLWKRGGIESIIKKKRKNIFLWVKNIWEFGKIFLPIYSISYSCLRRMQISLLVQMMDVNGHSQRFTLWLSNSNDTVLDSGCYLRSLDGLNCPHRWLVHQEPWLLFLQSKYWFTISVSKYANLNNVSSSSLHWKWNF